MVYLPKFLSYITYDNKRTRIVVIRSLSQGRPYRRFIFDYYLALYFHRLYQRIYNGVHKYIIVYDKTYYELLEHHEINSLHLMYLARQGLLNYDSKSEVFTFSTDGLIIYHSEFDKHFKHLKVMA